jgi:polar amino acid transport system substrate-binding protein
MRGVHCVLAWFLFATQSLVLDPQSSLAAEPSSLERIKKTGVLTVCLDPDNLPYSDSKKTPPGFDIEISKQIAKTLGVEAKFFWVDTIHDTPLGELLEEKCDCAVGTAIEANTADELANLGEKVLFTRPYYSSGYVLVVAALGERGQGPEQSSTALSERGYNQTKAPKSLAELKGKKIGAEAGSVADYNLNLKGHDRRLYPRQEAIFSGLDSGEIVAGFMWAPNVGWMLKNDSKRKYKLVDGYAPEPDFRWNVGIAVRKADRELKVALDKIIADLVKEGQAQKILSSYGVPYFPPFQ